MVGLFVSYQEDLLGGLEKYVSVLPVANGNVN